MAANDSDAWAAATHADNHPETRFVLGDITKPAIRKELLLAAKDQEIDLLAGGPPCQAFSQVRNHDRDTTDPRNSLYRQFLAFIEELAPKAFFMENVVGMQNIAGGSVGARIFEELSLGGKYLVSCAVLDSADHGVPQTRRRVVIAGGRRDLGTRPVLPRPLHAADRLQLCRKEDRRGRTSYRLPTDDNTMFPDETLLDRLLDPDDLSLVTVEQAISDLQDLVPAERIERKPSNGAAGYPGKPASAYQRRLRGDCREIFNTDVPSIREDTVRRLEAIPQGGNFRDIPAELLGRYLNGTKWGPDLGRDVLSRKHYYAYRRLHPDYFSWTLNTKTDCVYHYAIPRALSVREFARLHSFPDSYRFLHGDRHSRYQQVGNSVPPMLGATIARALLPLLQKPRAGDLVGATAFAAVQ